jgi:hypothetical protein
MAARPWAAARSGRRPTPVSALDERTRPAALDAPAAVPRTVFMIVAHNNPALLARLVERLEAPWSHIVVLIDAKAGDEAFVKALAGRRVVFMPSDQRVDVQWGGIGLTTAALRMMRETLARFSADRLCMLSGVDYPIKPIAAIGEALRGDVEFVRVDRALDPSRPGIHNDFVRYMYFNDVRLLNPRSSPLPPLQRAVTLALRVGPRSNRSGLSLFHGCGWWCITRAAADWTLDFFDRRPEVFAWLRHVNCPDEIFMQTLLKASPFAGRIAQDMTAPGGAPVETNVHGLHYIDWSQPKSSSPKTLELGDLPALAATSALFARKIDPLRSAALLDALDSQILI